MDDQQTYLLNGLLTRHFGLGRIVRFRSVRRGHEAEAFELFTAGEREYLVQLYPAHYTEEQLSLTARALALLDEHRFTVVPLIRSKGGEHFVEGPQGTRMCVSVAPQGSALLPEAYTEHDVSQVGLRLGWMHRLLKERLPAPEVPPDPVALLRAEGITLHEPLVGLLRLPTMSGWTHGDIQAEALLHDGDHQLRTVMDWGLLHWGCPMTDLVDAFLGIAMAADRGDSSRGKALLEAYDTLVPIKRMAWTPVVAWWAARRMLSHKTRPLPMGFHERLILAPERLATAIASCM